MTKKQHLQTIINTLISRGIKKKAIADAIGTDASIISRIIKDGVSEEKSENYISIIQEIFKANLTEADIIKVEKTEKQLLMELLDKVNELIDIVKKT